MFTKWTAHISDPEEKARFNNQVLSAKPVLERLYSLLEDEESSLDKIEMDARSFEKPNWAFRQAYYNGGRSTIHSLKKLIDLDQQKRNPNDHITG